MEERSWPLLYWISRALEAIVIQVWENHLSDVGEKEVSDNEVLLEALVHLRSDHVPEEAVCELLDVLVMDTSVSEMHLWVDVLHRQGLSSDAALHHRLP
jgi:hypothetical protein